MRIALLVAASVAPLLFTAATDASAQPRYGGGFRGGGWHGGGWHGGGGGWHGRGIGVRAGYPGYRAGWGWHGAGYRRPYAWGGYYPYRRWGGGGYPYWGVASGLATAATIGAVAAYPAYAYPAYAYPAYQAYPVYEVDASAIGGQCSTPVRICTLYDPAPLGTGCSCRVPGGRARGTVVGP